MQLIYSGWGNNRKGWRHSWLVWNAFLKRSKTILKKCVLIQKKKKKISLVSWWIQVSSKSLVYTVVQEFSFQEFCFCARKKKKKKSNFQETLCNYSRPQAICASWWSQKDSLLSGCTDVRASNSSEFKEILDHRLQYIFTMPMIPHVIFAQVFSLIAAILRSHSNISLSVFY